MKNTDEETTEDEKNTRIPQENIQQPSVNPFRSDALKSILYAVLATIAIGLICRFTDVEKTSYFKAIALVIEGNLAMKLVKDLKHYFGYKRYRENTDHDVSRDFYLNEMQRISEMYSIMMTKKRK